MLLLLLAWLFLIEYCFYHLVLIPFKQYATIQEGEMHPVVDINRKEKRRGIYSALRTHPKGIIYFSIYQIGYM